MFETKKRLPHWLPWTGKILVAVLLLYLLTQKVDLVSITHAWSGAEPLYIAAAFLLLPLNLWLQYRKWALMLHGVYPSVRKREIRTSLLLGFTFGLLTPARIGEYGGRAVALRNTKPAVLVGLTAADKLSTMVMTLGIGIMGVFIYGILHPFMDRLLLLVLVVALAIVVMGTIFVFVRLQKKIAVSGRLPGRLYRRLTSVFQAMNASTVKILLAWSGLLYFVFLLQFYLLVMAFGPVNLLSAFAGISTVMLIKTIVPPVTFGDLGIREGTAVIVLSHTGILAGAALSASLLLFVINLLIPALIGLPLLLRTSPAHDRVDDR